MWGKPGHVLRRAGKIVIGARLASRASRTTSRGPLKVRREFGCELAGKAEHQTDGYLGLFRPRKVKKKRGDERRAVSTIYGMGSRRWRS